MNNKDNSIDLLDAATKFAEQHKEDIAAKVRAGLTREQAIAVVEAQARHDASLAAEAKASTPAKAK
jgi:flagellar biosynthesis regulator FlaF